MQVTQLTLPQAEGGWWGTSGDGWQGTAVSQAGAGSGEVGGPSPCPPVIASSIRSPSPPLPAPGISQLIPLAASLRHLEGLKTATVPALTPGDPLASPAPSGPWHCPPQPPLSPFQEGHGCYVLVTPPLPAGAVGTGMG